MPSEPMMDEVTVEDEKRRHSLEGSPYQNLLVWQLDTWCEGQSRELKQSNWAGKQENVR